MQQLFFGHESKAARHVAFAAIEASAATATLCLDVAQALAEEDGHNVGLIDATVDSIPLPTQLQTPSPMRGKALWPIAPQLWMVPRETWLPGAGGQQITGRNLSRLHELTTWFDFSILCCASVSWATSSIGRICDGLVLVVTANKTRRLVAAQIKDQLNKVQVPVLGTVLAERRFPVPQGLSEVCELYG